MPVSTADKFIGFLQSKFAKNVDIPRTTDILRVAEFPGLESKREEVAPPPDFAGFDAGMMPEDPMAGMDMMEPMPGTAPGPLTGDDDELG